MEYLKDSLDTRQTEDGFFNLKSIKEHRASYPLSDPEYLGSGDNLFFEWEPGEITWEPLSNIMADLKHCGKFQARLVADGHLTKEPTETAYSGVVPLRNFRLVMFLAELNNLQLWGANVGYAYLQALTREKL